MCRSIDALMPARLASSRRVNLCCVRSARILLPRTRTLAGATSMARRVIDHTTAQNKSAVKRHIRLAVRIIFVLAVGVPASSTKLPYKWHMVSGDDFRRAIALARSRPNPVVEQIRRAVGKLKKP